MTVESGSDPGSPRRDGSQANVSGAASGGRGASQAGAARSAVPRSAVPRSAVPRSAVPRSAVPRSEAARSAAARSAASRSAEARSRSRARAGDPGGAGAPDADTGTEGAGRPRLTSRAAVLAVVICAIALSLAYPVREFIAQHRQIAQLQAQHRMEEAQVRSLQALRQRLSDPAYIEQQARARLHMCMPGETCYVIINGRPVGRLPRPPATARSAWYVTLWRSVQQADRPAAR